MKSKRVTVLRMLKKRLAESKIKINVSHQFEDLAAVYGSDGSKEEQHRKNMQTDIEQLAFLIKALKMKNKPKKIICECDVAKLFSDNTATNNCLYCTE